MPPWPADPAFGRFSNDRRLSDAEVKTIVSWVNAGAPKGPGTFAPPTFADGWLLGEPDLIVEMEQDYVVPAGGPDLNVEIPVPVRNLPHDIWVRAVEVRGNPSVVHHNVVYSVDAQGARDATGRLASFTPGKQYDLFNEPAGKLVKKGSTLVFSMHYHPNGTETRDRSKVGLFLATRPISYQIHSRVVADPRLEIPPRDSNYLSTGEFTFAVDAEITLFKPHMHWRGKDMKYVLRYPDGREETLLSVPKYDMNWQVSYELSRAQTRAQGLGVEGDRALRQLGRQPSQPGSERQGTVGQRFAGRDDGRLVRLSGEDARSGDAAHPAEDLESATSVNLAGVVSSRLWRLALFLTIVLVVRVSAQDDPVGVWNLRIRVGNIGEGYRTVLVRVERRDDALAAQASGVTPDLRDVEDFRYEDNTLRFATGAYEYELVVKADTVTGSVTSPSGRQEVSGARQSGLGFGGDVPEVLRKTWSGVIGHRTEGPPPSDVADPAGWLAQRMKGPDDVVLWQRRVPVGFANADRYRATLVEYAGKTVVIDGAWRTDRIEIATVKAETK